MTFYAHTTDGPESGWEPLEVHLREVSELAATFADAFGAKEWGRLAGLWHDLGKYSQEFQNYLKKTRSEADGHGEDSAAAPGRVDHSSAGAQWAVSTGPLGPLLAYLIAGHHAGLPDGVELRARLQKCIPKWEASCPVQLKEGALSAPTLARDEDAPPGAFRLALFLRMVFSSLTDADFLCTEGFMNRDQAAARPHWPDDLLPRMEQALVRKLDSFGKPNTKVDAQRLHVREACSQAAEWPPGFFDLTVPTGGGKTLASLLFALRHANLNGLRRVIYGIPYSSIIEQNADVFREVFTAISTAVGQDVVLEHHSNLQPDRETTRNRLAAENWDAPLVVTTNVQLFESIFACRTSACRKLHRIAKSVIILDEAQSIPPALLRPVLAALRCLVQDYGCTVVLCTATQPALERREGFDPGIPPEHIRSIVPERTRLYGSLKRVIVQSLGLVSNQALRDRLLNETGGTLAVVNTTKAARELYEALPQECARFHLSARMCPEHRSDVLKQVKHHLHARQPAVLISTQLIEAGVDVSFPAVYRAECGLDSLAQAAGRCNRNGELRDASGNEIMGRVFHFLHEGYGIPTLLVDLRDAVADARQLIERYAADLLSLEAIEQYFRLHIWTIGQRTKQWDKPDVMNCFQIGGRDGQFLARQFRSAADRFQMIPQATQPLVIPYGEAGRKLCEELRQRDRLKIPPAREHYRRAQRYTVQVYEHEWKSLCGAGKVEALHDGALHVLVHPENDYDNDFGLRPPGAAARADAFMA
jgi:CRISPR-associated endonuclease/helicase Cas3